MFGRRRDIQIPKVPVSGDKATQSWMTAVGSMLSKYIGGGSNDRLVSAGELIDGGLAGVGTGGFLTSPPRNLTKPPKVTGLTANGALASIFVGWHNPSFSNYAYTELWRADIDDIGQAVLIASTAVESYTDNVGSAATKYYWARAVSDQGVKGEFNAASGTKGTTSLDPDYVMQVLTSSTWKPNTTYYPFQYVRPTVENGFQYAAVDGGKSGSTEPTWPTTINATVNDGTIQWITVPVDARIPFVLGTLEDGTPAVFMDTAYIKNATITSAKIIELIADKIETGNLNADLQVKSKLWYGFNQPNGDFIDPLDNSITHGKTGFYFGVNGSNGLPVLHLNTGIANGSKSLVYDGYDLKLTGDGLFDDIFVDSARFETISTNTISYNQRVVPSDYITEQNIDLNNNDYQGYLCAVDSINKTTNNTGANYDIYLFSSSPTPLLVTGNGLIQVICSNLYISPYDELNKMSFVRFKDKKIAFTIKIVGFWGYGDAYDSFGLAIYSSSTSSGFYVFDLLPIMTDISRGETKVLTNTSFGKNLTVTIVKARTGGGYIIKGTDTNEGLNYHGDGSSIFVYFYAKYKWLYVSGTPSVSYRGVVPSLTVQLNKPEYKPVSNIVSDALLEQWFAKNYVFSNEQKIYNQFIFLFQPHFLGQQTAN